MARFGLSVANVKGNEQSMCAAGASHMKRAVTSTWHASALSLIRPHFSRAIERVTGLYKSKDLNETQNST